MVPLPFGSFSDPGTGRVRIRLVNTEPSLCRVAREYMIRLNREDLEDPHMLRPIAKAAGADTQGLPRPVRLSNPSAEPRPPNRPDPRSQGGGPSG